MQSIVVFCGSNAGLNSVYTKVTRQVGEVLAHRGLELIYGAGNIGLMGVLADAALAAGGRVVGVIPYFLRDKEVCHTGLSDLHLTKSMDERKVIMARLSDSVLVLPGGYGTMDELFEMLTLVQLRQAHFPIGILNINGFYDHLIQQVTKMQQEGFIKDFHRNLILVDDNIERLLDKMAQIIPSEEDK
ncbi:MAG: cytokinin riboside 5'-monophosphate phosphoribohydrolase [Saprospiraceae bacterium]|nr:MAG: cytokinin riboside 5'-monophosphate phosphoribohydrolase [Saprospiraceae bacterium]